MATGKDIQLNYKEVEQYISLLRDKHIPVLQAYLFGSYATGWADEWSDIDLAIVTDKFVCDGFDFRFLLTKPAPFFVGPAGVRLASRRVKRV